MFGVVLCLSKWVSTVLSGRSNKSGWDGQGIWYSRGKEKFVQDSDGKTWRKDTQWQWFWMQYWKIWIRWNERDVLNSPDPVSFSRSILLFAVSCVEWLSETAWNVPSYMAWNVSIVKLCAAMLYGLVYSTEGESSRYVWNVSFATQQNFTSKLCSPVHDDRVTWVSEHVNFCGCVCVCMCFFYYTACPITK